MKKNYQGLIILFPETTKSKTFYFLLLNPYDGKDAEFSIFLDSDHEDVYAEGIGIQQQTYNPHTGLPITAFDFLLSKADAKISVVFVVSQIISESIYQAGIAGFNPAIFTHYWEQQFNGPTEGIARNFLKTFGL